MRQVTKQSLVDKANRIRQRRLVAIRKGIEHKRPTQEIIKASETRWTDLTHEIDKDA